MAALLEDLELLGEEHEELYDTEVRENLWLIADDYLLKQRRRRLHLPEDLGMFSEEANKALKAVLEDDLPKLREIFKIFELNTEAKRRASFLNPKLHTEKGRYVDEFFGHP